VPPPSHPTSCTSTTSNLYLDSPLETVIREPALYKLLTFHIPNLISILLLRSFIQRIRPGPRLYCVFRNKFIFYSERLLALRPTLKLEDHPLSFISDCLFNLFAATPHSWRSSLHPQLEDVTCCGDRGPPNMASQTELCPIYLPPFSRHGQQRKHRSSFCVFL
jgi:hypothetical protein